MNKQIEDNFKLNENNLWECNFCKTTLESRNECERHLEECRE